MHQLIKTRAFKEASRTILLETEHFYAHEVLGQPNSEFPGLGDTLLSLIILSIQISSWHSTPP